MVTISIMGVVFSAMASMQTNMNKEASALQERIALLDFEKSLIQHLADGSLCTFMLTDPNYSATNPISLKQGLSDSTSIANVTLPGEQIAASLSSTASTGPALVKVNSTIDAQTPSLVVKSVIIEDIVSLGSNHYSANFVVRFHTEKMVRGLKPIKVSTSLQTDPTVPNRITSCSPITSLTCQDFDGNTMGWTQGPGQVHSGQEVCNQKFPGSKCLGAWDYKPEDGYYAACIDYDVWYDDIFRCCK
jgi:hypothetical protein